MARLGTSRRALRRGWAWYGMARCGKAWHFKACTEAGLGVARHGRARYGWARLGLARFGVARLGEACTEAWQCGAGCGTVWQGTGQEKQCSVRAKSRQS